MKTFITIAFVLGAAGQAAAQTPTAEPPQSVLPNVMNTATGAALDARIDFTDVDNATLVGANLHFQYLTPPGLGGYVQLPFGYVDSDFVETDTVLGNVELGGVYVMRNPGMDIFLRGGFALETANDEGNFVVPSANFVSRPADAFSSGLDTSWFRGHAGLRSQSNNIVFGGSAGLDVPLDQDSDTALLVVVGSIGVQQPGFGLGAGFTFLQAVGDDADDDDNTISFNATADFEIGARAKLYGSFGVNLEDEFDGYSLGVGIRAGL